MQAVLVRVGVDSVYGRWNAPVDPESGEFVYVPIPEKEGTLFLPGLARGYSCVIPALEQFCRRFSQKNNEYYGFPDALRKRHMHLDPDFDYLTYGDRGDRRGIRIAELKRGDLLVFYAGLNPISPTSDKLVYALIGLYVVQEVVLATEVSRRLHHQNAHTRKLRIGEPDIVVRAKRGLSGRFDRCIPIGEWRNRAYRVRRDLLSKWGGLSVKDGYIQRSAVPPTFNDPQRFYNWFKRQSAQFIASNN